MFNGDSEIGPSARLLGRECLNAACSQFIDYPLAQSPTQGTIRTGNPLTNVPPRDIFGSYHPGLCQFAMVDGSVRALSNTTNLMTLDRLSRRADGLPIPDF